MRPFLRELENFLAEIFVIYNGACEEDISWTVLKIVRLARSQGSRGSTKPEMWIQEIGLSSNFSLKFRYIYYGLRGITRRKKAHVPR